MEELQVLISWKIWHDYFREGRCTAVELQPDYRTRELLQRRKLLWKKVAVNEWVLLGTADLVTDPEDELTLNVTITDAKFFYYTEGEGEEKIKMPLSWKGQRQNVIRYKAKRLYWEYLLLNRQAFRECNLELKDTSEQLLFGVSEIVDYAGRKGIRMVSAEKVALKEFYDYRLRLSEVTALGRRVLRKSVPLPQPGHFPDAAEECVRQVVYF